MQRLGGRAHFHMYRDQFSSDKQLAPKHVLSNQIFFYNIRCVSFKWMNLRRWKIEQKRFEENGGVDRRCFWASTIKLFLPTLYSQTARQITFWKCCGKICENHQKFKNVKKISFWWKIFFTSIWCLKQDYNLSLI